MYLIISTDGNGVDYWGPFPNEDRAKRYAEAFEGVKTWRVEPLIVAQSVVRHIYWMAEGERV